MERGWDRELIRRLILEATSRVENKPDIEPSTQELKDVKDTLFIHFKFHKDGVSRQEIRAEYEEYLEKVCNKDLGLARMIVAYSMPLNIGDYVTQAKLHQAPGKNASKIFGEFKSGLDPWWTPLKIGQNLGASPFASGIIL